MLYIRVIFSLRRVKTDQAKPDLDHYTAAPYSWNSINQAAKPTGRKVWLNRHANSIRPLWIKQNSMRHKKSVITRGVITLKNSSVADIF